VAETRRVVLATGEVREVLVRAGHSFTDGVGYFARLSPTDTMAFGADPRGAVLRLEDVWRHPTHAEGQAGAAVTILARILRDDCGESHDAALARAQTIYAAHLARLEREAVEALLTERAPAERARAAADRHTAELALGTAGEGQR